MSAIKTFIGMFSCKHPAGELGILQHETVNKSDDDFNIVTYHLFCRVCGEPVKLSYAQMIGGVDGFLSRGLTHKESSK
jgi:hypothetical protein